MTVIEAGLVTYLRGNAGMIALISTRTYHMRIPQKATLPCLVFQRVSTPRLLTHDSSGSSGDLIHPRFQFVAYAADDVTPKSISDALRAALNGKTSTVGGVTIRAALADEEVPEYDPETKYWSNRSEYIIWLQE